MIQVIRANQEKCQLMSVEGGKVVTLTGATALYPADTNDIGTPIVSNRTDLYLVTDLYYSHGEFSSLDDPIDDLEFYRGLVCLSTGVLGFTQCSEYVNLENITQMELS